MNQFLLETAEKAQLEAVNGTKPQVVAVNASLEEVNP